MFLNCLLLDLTVIDLISIVHMGRNCKKILECGRPGGRGGLLLSLHNPVARAARALAGRYTGLWEIV